MQFQEDGLKKIIYLRQHSQSVVVLGGRVIKNDIVAACGLHLEFGNKVVTSRIKKIFHISSNST